MEDGKKLTGVENRVVQIGMREVEDVEQEVDERQWEVEGREEEERIIYKEPDNNNDKININIEQGELAVPMILQLNAISLILPKYQILNMVRIIIFDFGHVL